VNGNGRKDSLLVAAEAFVEQGQLDKALMEYGRIVAEDPGDTSTWLKMAELHARLGANEEAAAIYSRTGELFIDQGFAKKAAAVYKQALKLAPGAPKGHMRLGVLYKQLGYPAEAVRQFELAGAALQAAGAGAEAVGAFRQAAATEPDNPVLHVKLAEAASSAGLVEEAVREFGRAADQLKAAGRVDEALRVLERLLFHQPDNVTRARELAEAYVGKGNPRLALPKLQACLNASPREPRTLALLARALEQLGQNDKAASVLKELARLLHELGRGSERDAAVRRALELAPADAEVQALAVRHGVRGAPDADGEATPPPAPSGGEPGGGRVDGSFDLSGAVRSAQGNSASARVTAPVGASESSARILASAPVQAGAAPDTFDVARVLSEADVFVKYGMLDRAAEHLGQVFARDPENREARERAGTVLEKLGRRVEAARHFEILARQVAPGDPSAARRFAERAAALDPGAARGGAGPSTSPRTSSSSKLRPLSRAALARDEDPAAALRTPPPAPPEDPATPPPDVDAEAAAAPLAARDRRERSGFEQDVTTGDVVAVVDDSARSQVSLSGHIAVTDEDYEEYEEGATQVTPPPGTPERTPRVVALTRKSGSGPVARDPAAPEPPSEDSGGGFDPAPITSPGAPSRGGSGSSRSRPTGQVGTLLAADELGQELEQVAFFLAQALPEEARALLADLAQRFPGDARVVMKLREIAAYEARMAAAEAALAARAAEARPVTGAAPRASTPATAPLVGGAAPGSSPRGSGGDGTTSPRAFVEAGGAADLTTHFDLAIAYKEMGLYDAAIAELRVVAQDPNREVMALTMMGECFEAKGSFTDAVIRYKEALNCTPITSDETMQLYFLLGGAFDRLGDASEALYFFEKVARRDPRFREVGRRIAEIRPKLAKTVFP
jgi:tetratricopeptide (TPR) repeat protein